LHYDIDPIVGRDACLHEVCRYTVPNPVRAGLVAYPGQWAWSSDPATAGEAPLAAFLTADWMLSLGNTPARGQGVAEAETFAPPRANRWSNEVHLNGQDIRFR